MPQKPYPESERCADCGRTSSFEWSEEEDNWVSVCCTAYASPVEPPENDDAWSGGFARNH